MKEKKLVYGVGINDAPYRVYKTSRVGGKQVVLWQCPYYRKWVNMLKRCYSEKYLINSPTYRGCSVAPEWNSFMIFRAWMETQDWEGKHLEKDLLFPDNRVYGPDTCIFVDEKVNLFITESTAKRGEWPVGVSFHKHHKKFQAKCEDVLSGNTKHLGYYKNPHDAHQAWLTFKLEQAKIIASQQSDLRVAAALIDRYQNYPTYFGS